MTRLASCAILCGALALAACAAATSGAEPSPQLAITMDDLPVHGPLPDGETRRSVAERMVKAFRDAGVPEVYGFVNAAGLEDDPELESVLTVWRAAGYPLGNHAWSHANLNQAGVEGFREEIVRNEPVLQRLGEGKDWHWFRYPYLAEGNDPAKRDSVRAILARRGYRIAAVTSSFADYEWSDAYVRCRDGGNQAALDSLEVGYLDAVREEILRSRALSQAVYGRDVPYVLLTHISAFNARMMPRVLEVYRDADYEFVTLAEAQRDSIYRGDMDPSIPARPTTLEGPARARGVTVPPRTNRAEMLNAICR